MHSIGLLGEGLGKGPNLFSLPICLLKERKCQQQGFRKFGFGGKQKHKFCKEREEINEQNKRLINDFEEYIILENFQAIALKSI